MTTAYSTLLGLALPVEGELDGTWGDMVNYGITDYVDVAVAGTVTLTNDGAVTLSNTNGDTIGTNIVSSLTGTGTATAQHAIVRVTGTLTTTKVITAPSTSKTFIVVNDATGGSVTLKASGQSGVTVAVGDKALVAFNGTDYVRIGASAGGSNTQVQYNNSGNLAGSANLTFDGTTLTAAGVADSSLTSGRVTYAGAGGNLTDSANLAFDGTTLTANNIIDSSLTASKPVFTDASKNLVSTGTLGVDQGGTGQTSYTNGQLLIGNTTGNTLTKATLTAGSNISITNGAGSITIASTSSGITTGKSIAMAMIFGF